MINKLGLDDRFRNVNIGDNDGMDEATSLGVRTVPTLQDTNGDVYVGVKDCIKFIRTIEGNEENEK